MGKERKRFFQLLRLIVLVVAIVVLARLGYQVFMTRGAGQSGSGDAGLQEPPAPPAIPVRVYQVSRTLFRDQLPLLGTITGISEIELKFEVQGMLARFEVAPGDLVSAGDLIAQLDPRDAELKIRYASSKADGARAAYDAARVKLRMHESLSEIGAIVPVKLEEVRAETEVALRQLETAEVELESSKSEFEKTVLKAPRDGVITSQDAEVGEFVSPQNPVATMMEIHEVFVVLGVIEKDIERISIGQPVKITVDTYPGTEFEGLVDQINPMVEGKGRTLPVKVRVSNYDSRLLPGMFARAVITVFEQDNAVVIPSISLNRNEETGEFTVMVVEDKKASERPVTVGYITTDYAQIDSGLEEGELVVVESQTTLKNGADVEVLEVQEASF